MLGLGPDTTQRAFERGWSVLRGYERTVRYARNWKTGGGSMAVETTIRRDGSVLGATLHLPRDHRGRMPGWVAIGGVSRMGRFHPQLVRFAESLAASGAAVLVPEIPEWKQLRVTPAVIGPTLRASIDVLRERPEVRPERFGAIGFSFGAAGLAVAASDERISADISGTVLFGGYCCLERTLRCFLTGRHEWQGAEYSLSPDPYGRWVVGSNHLTAVPGLEDATDVAGALRTLAAAASDERIAAWDPYHDPMILGLREALPPSRRPVFDCFATASTSIRPDSERCADLARRLAAACRRVDPLLEPSERLHAVDLPTQVIHGHGDRLVPFTEAHRLMDGIRDRSKNGLTVTRLFHHKSEHQPDGLTERISERVRLFEALRRLIDTTSPSPA